MLKKQVAAVLKGSKKKQRFRLLKSKEAKLANKRAWNERLKSYENGQAGKAARGKGNNEDREEVSEASSLSSDESEDNSEESSDDRESEKEKNSKNKKKEQRKWFQSNWPIEKFNEKAPLNEKKPEWIKFRDQFNRVIKTRGAASDRQKIDALKIYAGSYLLQLISIVERDKKNRKIKSYKKLIKALDAHFNGAFDKQLERLKFSGMKQLQDEAFDDWVMRLQRQMELCEFTISRQTEELKLALIKKSKPEIAEKLFELSGIFKDDIKKYVAQGQLLDQLGDKKKEQQETDTEKPVNAIKTEFKQKPERFRTRPRPYPSYRSTQQQDGIQKNPTRYWAATNDRAGAASSCFRCGLSHPMRPCPAASVQCHKCGKTGHYGRVCESKGMAEQNLQGALHTEPAEVNKVNADQIKEESLNCLLFAKKA